MKAETVAFLGALIFHHQQLLPLLEEHLDDQNGEMLPHLLMADITRWLIDRILNKGKNDIVLKEILEMLSKNYGKAQKIDELIFVSFLENLPKVGEKGAEIREVLDSKLKNQLRLLG